MAVFTTIATAIVGALGATVVAGVGTILGSTFLYSMAVGVVAAGLGLLTAKLLGVFDVPGAGPDPGSKVQVAPSTDNKIGVAYGRNFMSGPITDVNISNQNKTMHYCITLSEVTDGHGTSTYTSNQIFWGDRKLNFSGASVSSFTDPTQTAKEDWANKIRIRIYAGGTAAANQVFPTSGAVDATTMMPHWTNTTAYSMEDLVFAMIELDYDAENGLTGLGSMSFDLSNSKHNPGEVLFDYLKSTRYGCGLANADIDITSILGTANTQMKGYCDEQISYTPNTGGSSTIDRYQINGYLSTFKSCMDNVDSICRNSATFFTFDGKQGKFSAVPNRAYLASELTNAFVLNDDNIISKISITSTELYNTLNSITVTFADQNRKDQTNTVEIETPAGERNTGEPDNNFEYRAELVNNNIHARQLGNIDLNQSREGMVVNLVGDYSCLQIDAGDVVKLTNTDYGFSDKLFRVMKNKELFGEDGMITCELLLLEYDADAYVVATVVESDEEDDSTDIPALPPIPPIIPPIVWQNFYFAIDQDATTGTGTGSKYTIIKSPNANTSLAGTYSFVYSSTVGSGHSIGDVITIDGGKLGGVTVTNNLTFRVASVTGGGGVDTVDTITGNAFVLDPQTYGSSIMTGQLANLSLGAQIEDQPASQTSFSNANTVANLFTPRELDFSESLDGIEPGDYSFFASAAPIGAMPGGGTANYSLRGNVNLKFPDGSGTTQEFGTDRDNDPGIPTAITAVRKITIPAGTVSANVVLKGRNTLTTNASGQVGFNSIKYDMVRLNKGDIF
jgi:hypothetical protein